MDQDRLSNKEWTHIEQHETPIDVEAIWAGIQSKQPKKKRRSLWFFLSGFTGLLVLSLVLFFTINDSDNSPENLNTLAQTEKPATNDLEKTSPSAPKETTENDATKKSISTINTLPKETLRTTHQAKLPLRKLEEDINPDLSTQGENYLIRNNSTSAVTSLQSTTSALHQTVNITSVNRHAVKFRENADISIQNIPFLTIFLDSKSSFDFTAKMDLIDYPSFKQKAQKSKRAWSLSFALSTAGFYNSKKLISMESSEYAMARKQSETPLETIAYESDIRVTSPSGVFVSTGFHLMRMTEKFEHQFMTTTVMQPNAQTSFILHIDNRRLYNHINLWEIPLHLGFVKERNKWNYRVQAGPNYNFALSTEGASLNASGALDQISDMDLYNDKVGLSLSARMGIGYRLTEKISLEADVYGKRYQQNFLTPTSQMDQRHKFIGGLIGLCIRL